MEDVLRRAMIWATGLNAPWFLAGTGLGVPAAIAAGSTVTANSQAVTTLSTVGGFLGGVAADYLSSTFLRELSSSFTCYDVLTRGAGPACLLLVILSRSIRSQRSSAVLPAAAVALAALLIEPIFSAFMVAKVFGINGAGVGGTAAVTTVSGAAGRLGFGRVLGRKKATSAASAAAAAASVAAETAVARARWFTAGAQVSLWGAVVLAYAELSLRFSRAGKLSKKTIGGYMTAMRALAAKKRGNGGWVRVDEWGESGCWGRARSAESGAGAWGEKGDGHSRARTHGLLGSLFDRLAGGGWSGTGASRKGSIIKNANGPPFERGEVTVRDIYCLGLDAAITGRRTPDSSSAAASHFASDDTLTAAGGGTGGRNAAGGISGADGGGGGGRGAGMGRGGVGVAGGTSRPFYVTVSLGGLTARTSVQPGFSPAFTEVFPLGSDCPVKGAFLVLSVVDSFETGRSGRGDRVVGEVHVPLDAAELVPGTSADGFSGGPTYRLTGYWELQGIVGPLGAGAGAGGAKVGADVVIRGPPSPTSAAGRLRRRRESVGWYAR